MAESSGQAATYTWQTAGSTNTWATATGNANWYVDSGTTYSNWVNGNAAVFDNTTDATVTVTGTVAPTSVTIGASAPAAFTITGGTLAFGSQLGVIDSFAVGTANNRVITISSNLTGSNGLTIKAHGDLSGSGGGNSARFALGGDNTGLTGGIAITGGLVDGVLNTSFGNNTITLSNFGGILDANHSLTLGNNIVVESTGGTIRNYGLATTTLNGTLTGSGALNHTDGGNVVLTANSSAYTGAYSNLGGTTTISGNGSLRNASSVSITAGNLYIRRSGTYNTSSILPSTISFGAASATFEFNPTDVTAVMNLDLDLGVSTVNGRFRVSGGTLNMVSGTDVIVNSVSIGLQSATNRGTLNIVAGSSITTLFFNIGADGNNSGTVNQTGGLVTLQAGSSGFRLGHYTNGTNAGSAYNLTGGVLDATGLSTNGGFERYINVGWDGAAVMTVGGGAGTATLKTFGVQLDMRTPDTATINTLSVLTNGMVEIGAGGTLSGNVTDNILLAGGTLKATAASTWATSMDAVATTTSVVDTNGNNVTFTSSITGTGILQVIDSASGGVFTLNSGTGSQTLTASLAGNGAISKIGTGTTTLSGGGTYSGTISHTAGTLLVTGNQSAAAVNVADGATFGGEGTIASLVMGSSTGAVFRVDPVTAGALSIAGNVSFNGTIQIAYSVSPDATGNAIRLFSYGGTLTGLANLVLPGSTNYRAASISDVGGIVSLSLGNKNLLWNGTSGGQWQVGAGVNRWNTSEVDAFYWGDAVRFDDTGVTPAITITGELSPSAIIVDASTKDYTITGGTGNFISGTATLLKAGTSTLTMTGPNTYTGATTIRQGALLGRSATAFGAGPIVLGDSGTAAGVLALYLDPIAAGANITMANAITVNPVSAATTAVIGTVGANGTVITRSATFSGAITLNDDVILRSGAYDGTTFSGSITGDSALTIAVESNTVTPSGATALQIGKGQAGNRVLLSADANGFLGNWVIKSGTATSFTIFQLNSADRINNNSNMNIEEFAVFRLNAASETTNVLTGSGRVRGAVSTRTLSVGGGNGSGTFNGILENDTFDSGFLAFTKTGTGTQILTGLNTYTSITTVSGGVLEVTTLANGGVSSGIGASTSVATNLVLNGGVLRYSGATDVSIDRFFTLGTSGGGFESSGTGTLTLATVDSAVLAGTNTARTFSLGGSNTGANTFVSVITDNGTGLTAFTKSGVGKWILTATQTFTGAINISGGTLQLGDGGSTGGLAGSGTITMGANTTLNYNRTGESTLSRTFAGAGTAVLVHDGTGSLTLTGNILPNSIIINSGTVTLTGGAGFGTSRLEGNGTVTINSGSTLVVGGAHAFGGRDTGMTDAAIVNGTGRIVLNSEQYFNNLTLNNGGSVTGGGNLRASNATNWSVTGASTTASQVTNSIGHYNAANWNVDNITGNAGVDLVVSGQFTNAGALNKGGAGTMEITGSINSYSGGTNVNAGTLLANNTAGSATGTGQVTVGVGATLAGRGFIAANNANITINGTLSIGNSGDDILSDLNLHLGTGSGTVLFNGTLAFDIFGFERSEPDLASDHGQAYGDVLKFNTTAAVQLGGTLQVTDASGQASNWILGDSWQLIDWANVTSGGITGSFSNYVLPDLATGLKWDTSQLAQTGYISIVAVPEPGRMALLLFAISLLVVRRRRK